MKLSRLISGLHNSTKATLVACSAILAIAALILFFLMLFPIKMRDRDATLSAPVVMPETTTTVAETEPEVIQTTEEAVHTLSTWAASAETMESTDESGGTNDSVPWYDKIFTTSASESESVPESIQEAETWTEVIYEVAPAETQPPAPEPTPEPVTVVPTNPPVQTITETVAPPPPPVPEEPEIINAEPTAPVE